MNDRTTLDPPQTWWLAVTNDSEPFPLPVARFNRNWAWGRTDASEFAHPRFEIFPEKIDALKRMKHHVENIVHYAREGLERAESSLAHHEKNLAGVLENIYKLEEAS